MTDLLVQLRVQPHGSGEICRKVLAALPDWFGVPDANEWYVRVAECSPTVVAALDGQDIGLLVIVRHSAEVAEIAVMGVLPQHHRRGIGEQLVERAEQLLAADGVRYLQVKTLSARRPDENYERTRAFYRACGFHVLEEMPDLWGAEDPAVQMVKALSLFTTSSNDAAPLPASGLETPLLVLVTGVPGTGKSTIADTAGRQLGATVLAHDWAMSGLRPYPQVQQALDVMDPSGHRVVGWSILLALARSELRRGRPIVLDGVARDEQIEQSRQLAQQERSHLFLIATECSDVELHRQRIEGRRRMIPNWYELDWESVALARVSWTPPPDADLVLDAARSWKENATELSARLCSAIAGR